VGRIFAAMQGKRRARNSRDDDFVAQPRLVADLKDAGPMDVVFLCVKASWSAAAAPHWARVLGT